MKIEFDLSDKAVRMIRALGVLSGQNHDDISQFVSQLLEDGLKNRIADEIGIDLTDSKPMVSSQVKEEPKEEPQPQRSLVKKPVNPAKDHEDITEIADGLGDADDSFDDEGEEEDSVTDEEEEVVQGLQDAEALVPHSGGLDENAIAQDMAVSSPEEEAKVDSPLWQKSAEEQAQADQNPEETFSQLALDMSFPDQGAEGEEVDHRILKRNARNPRAKRAKVSAFTGNNPVEAGL